ncbi:Nitrogen fixation regulation protein FixK [Methylobacterium bullatum]|uniref:Nitrogen fixation regulation protein FixK n=1 Tax=Methylobacterium bullatum TaxID=570505 RepID=A0A679ISD9_9HYPH|nr:Nitrogen fixation regulation protein FixK [Methylobacterium bullatum]
MESVFNPLVQKLEGFVALDEADRDVLHRLTAIARDVPARTNLAREGEPHNDIVLITEGIGCRFKQRANGARQITAYLVPGDTCDLDIILLNRLDHTIATLSACKVARIPAPALRQIMENHPAIARALRVSALIDEATLREWLVNIGCRSALERIAHLFCELLVRLRAVGLATEDSCDLPMTQHELADTTGMTTVHVNRSLQELRRRGLIELKGKNLKILDWSRLKSLAEFKAGYLRVEGQAAS